MLNSRQPMGQGELHPFIASCSYSGETSTNAKAQKRHVDTSEATRRPMVRAGETFSPTSVKRSQYPESNKKLSIPAGRLAVSQDDDLRSRIAIQKLLSSGWFAL